MKHLLKNHIASYLCILAFGILMGTLFNLILNRPHHGILWGLGSWKTGSYGIWLTTCAIMILISESRRTAIINTALYGFSLLFVTSVFTAGHVFTAYFANTEAPESLASYLFGHLSSYTNHLTYCMGPLIPAFVLLAAGMYFGKENSTRGMIIRHLPMLYLISEASIYAIGAVFIRSLMPCLMLDLICLCVYYLFLLKYNRVPLRRRYARRSHTRRSMRRLSAMNL